MIAHPDVRARRGIFVLFGAAALGLAATGCPPTVGPRNPDPPNGPQTKYLRDVLREVAPSFRVKAPAGGDAGLGRRLVGEVPEINACFDGDVAEDAPDGRWDRIETEYETSASGRISVDFGALLQVPLDVATGAEGGKRLKLTLLQVREKKVSNLFFKADGNCADGFEKTRGGFASVITRALRAQSLEIAGESEIVAKAKLDVVKIGGAEATTGNKNARRWEGSSLFFADYPECVQVTLYSVSCEDKAVGPGNVCDLGTCSFQVETKDPDNTWTGSLSCQGGSKTPFAGSLGAWQPGKRVEPGVSYNLRVLNGKGVGSVTIDLRKWVVGTADSEKCATPASP